MFPKTLDKRSTPPPSFGSAWKPKPVASVSFGGQHILPVEQQPGGNYGYIPNRAGTVSQFQSASTYGGIGILGHNYLSGAEFFNIKKGQNIAATYLDGSRESFRVDEIRRLQALSPLSPYSDFVDLDTGKKFKYDELFHSVYNKDNNMVFQTCIEKDGNRFWGRYFVIARKQRVGGR